ncbi:porin family protein [Chryseobacterium sp. MFBS3-17]|uniref:porin family protein n=1 Tax=Chryseobacterium sp. MFBS3-17 TaxID=2886689 RepID=UPI001D0F1059|nr:porin family protein [Chryseobacterium sp. MFBS3-17]MCC2590101.1 PorT family protein [Chryseobacterium sp. MFBS3-17]
MKKFIICMSVLMAAPSFAQIDFSSTRFGVAAGYNYSRVRHAHNPSGARSTFQAGGLALIPIGGDDQFYLQPELVYYGAGETGKNKDMKGKPGYDAVYAHDYISLPVYFKGYFSEAESEFFALVGPRFNYVVSQKVKNPSREYYNIEGDPAVPGVNGKVTPFTMAIGGGVGFSFNRTLEVTLRADLGLTNMYKNLMREPGTDVAIMKQKKENVLSVGVNYIFE